MHYPCIFAAVVAFFCSVFSAGAGELSEVEIFGVELGPRSIDGWLGETFTCEGNDVVAGDTRYAEDKRKLLGTEDGNLHLFALGFKIDTADFEPGPQYGYFSCTHAC